MRFTVVTFAENEFSEFHMFDNQVEAYAFANGVCAGAGLYGSGNCCCYVLPDEEQDMRADQSSEEVDRALKAVSP